LDVQARASLWKGGLDYGHGTGHGIGYFLSVHEAPPYILYSSTDRDLSLTVGMVLSDGRFRLFINSFSLVICFYYYC